MIGFKTPLEGGDPSFGEVDLSKAGTLQRGELGRVPYQGGTSQAGIEISLDCVMPLRGRQVQNPFDEQVHITIVDILTVSHHWAGSV